MQQKTSMKPKCRYKIFKECPEKPFYVREYYPWGPIKQINKDGCNCWHIDTVSRVNPPGDVRIELCIDMWTAIYLQSYGHFARGQKIATEQMRNGLCDQDVNGRFRPKVNQATIILADAIGKGLSTMKKLGCEDNNGLITFKERND